MEKQAVQFINPKSVLLDAGVTAGSSVVDFGSGAGHWALVAAKLVGPSGRVLAVDDKEDMLSMVSSLAKHGGNDVVESKLVDFGSKFTVSDDCFDIVVVANTLYSIVDKAYFAKVAAAMVADDGRLVLVDWASAKRCFGPVGAGCLTEEQAIAIFEKAGLKLACTLSTGDHHFGLIFDKQGNGCYWKGSDPAKENMK